MIARLTVPAIALLSYGCGDSEASAAFAASDSAGVSIATSSRPVWKAGEEWRLSEAPLVQIGTVEGDPRYQFEFIVGAHISDRGEIVLADAGSREVRFFDPRGTHLRSVGRRGSGPGEFERIMWFGPYAGDSLLLYDLQLRRYSVLDAEGNVIRQVRQEGGIAFPIGPLDDGSIVWTAARIFRSGEGASGPSRDTSLIFVAPPGGEQRDTVGLLGVTDRLAHVSDNRVEVGPLPFGLTAHLTVGDSLLFVGAGEEFRVDAYDRDGALRRSVRLTRAPRRATQDDRDRYSARERERLTDTSRRALLERRLRDMPWPERMPAHDRIVVDAERNLWVQEYTPESGTETHWQVFEPGGRWLGTVSMPAGLTVRRITGDRILATWRDDLEVHHVRVYALVKPARNQEARTR